MKWRINGKIVALSTEYSSYNRSDFYVDRVCWWVHCNTDFSGLFFFFFFKFLKLSRFLKRGCSFYLPWVIAPDKILIVLTWTLLIKSAKSVIYLERIDYISFDCCETYETIRPRQRFTIIIWTILWLKTAEHRLIICEFSQDEKSRVRNSVLRMASFRCSITINIFATVISAEII